MFAVKKQEILNKELFSFVCLTINWIQINIIRGIRSGIKYCLVMARLFLWINVEWKIGILNTDYPNLVTMRIF